MSECSLLLIGCQDSKPLQKLEGCPFVMEVDTGATVSLINETIHTSHCFFQETFTPVVNSSTMYVYRTGEKIAVKVEI